MTVGTVRPPIKNAIGAEKETAMFLALGGPTYAKAAKTTGGKHTG